MVQTRSGARSVIQATRVSIDLLTDELLLEVLRLLHTSCINALLAIARVSIRWHALAQDVLESSIGPLVLGGQHINRTRMLFQRLRTDSSFRRRLKHISIRAWRVSDRNIFEDVMYFSTHPVPNPYHGNGYFTESYANSSLMSDQAWVPMQNLIHLLPHLRLATFQWMALPQMPLSLVRALSAQEKCCMSIRGDPHALRAAQWSYTPYLNTTFVNPLGLLVDQLSSLEVMVPAADGKLLQQLGHVVAGSKALRSLSCHAVARIWRTAIVPTSLQDTIYNEDTAVASLSPLLSSLSVSHGNRTHLEELALTNFCICDSPDGHNLLDQLEWQDLRVLNITCCSLLEYMCTRSSLISTLRLELAFSKNREYGSCITSSLTHRLKEALRKLTRLQRLAIINGTEFLDKEVLSDVAHDLRSLEVHERGADGRRFFDGHVLDVDTLTHLHCACPRLDRLSLDAPIQEKLFHAFLLGVRSIPSIREFSLYR